MLTIDALKYKRTLILTHLKLCFATATHNVKRVKIANICLFWDQVFANLGG